MHYYKLLERSKSQDSDYSDSEFTDNNNNNNNNIPAEFLCQAIFAGGTCSYFSLFFNFYILIHYTRRCQFSTRLHLIVDRFHDVEAAYGRLEGVVRTSTGYYGGSIRKPSYKEVSEGKTGHTEAVKITYDKRIVSYKSLCDFFWETHDPTNKNSFVSLSIKIRLPLFLEIQNN